MPYAFGNCSAAPFEGHIYVFGGYSGYGSTKTNNFKACLFPLMPGVGSEDSDAGFQTSSFGNGS